MKTKQVGWGAERMSFTIDEVVHLNELMKINGGSIYDTIRAFTRGKTLNQDEVIRLVFIAENRIRLMKTCQSIELGTHCDSYSVSKQ